MRNGGDVFCFVLFAVSLRESSDGDNLVAELKGIECGMRPSWDQFVGGRGWYLSADL